MLTQVFDIWIQITLINYHVNSYIGIIPDSLTPKYKDCNSDFITKNLDKSADEQSSTMLET